MAPVRSGPGTHVARNPSAHMKGSFRRRRTGAASVGAAKPRSSAPANNHKPPNRRQIPGGFTMRKTTLAGVLAVLTFLAAGRISSGQGETAIGQRGNWDTSVSEIGQRAGIFKKHGLELDIVYTKGRRNAAGGHFRQCGPRHRGRRHGRSQRLFERCAPCASSVRKRPAPGTFIGT